MKNLNKKLLLSFLTVVLTFIALGTSTFAWFTIGQEVTAGNFNTQVQSMEGLEISEDGVNWRNVLSFTDNTTIVNDLTSVDGKAIYTNSEGTEATTNFIKKDLYFRVKANTDNTVINIYLEEVTHTDFLTGTNWTADVTATTTTEDQDSITAGTRYLFDALNALKISFTPYTDHTAANNGTEEADDTAFIYEIEGTSSHGSASYNGLAKAYADAKGYSIAAPTNRGDLPTYVNACSTTATSVLNTNGTTLTLNTADGFYYGKVCVRMWLEGWDADCINAILGLTNVTVGFKFSMTATQA